MDVYVFGAGASVPYGAPTMSEFLSRAFWPWIIIPHETTDFDSELQVVAEAIKEQYGIDLDSSLRRGDIGSVMLEKINFEQLLALADEIKNAELRKALERVIYKTLERSLEPAMGNWDPNKEYETLVKYIIASGKQACLLSFNYDWMLDRALVDAAHKSKVTWAYGLPFKAGIENFPSYPRVDDPQIYLLKLHGSVHWCQCVNCEECLRLYYFIRYDPIYGSKWPACETCSGTDFRPVLVAPTPLKNIPAAMHPAWDKAATCLSEAHNLVIIGYSFPAFDRQARDLFLRNSIFPNLYSDDRPKLTLVLRDECARETVGDWFLPAVDKNVNEYCSFEEFCAVLRK